MSRLIHIVKKNIINTAIIISLVITAIQIVMLLINIKTHFMFYVDDNGEYVTTDYRSIMFYMQFATYITIGAISLFVTLRKNKDINYKNTFVPLVAVTAAPVFFGVFQMIYPDAPYDSIGFSMGCLIIHTFLTLDYEREVVNLNELQIELNDALDKAQAASKAKTSFLFNMSHDVRTPLNAILGFTTMAKKHADEPELIKSYLEKIDISGNQLLELINQVLEMSRIEAGKVVLQENKVDLLEHQNIFNTIYSAQAITKSIFFTVESKNIKHNLIICDKDRLTQIINNIISNSIKYTVDGGKINYTITEVECEKDGYAKFEFCIKDTGIGISEEYLPHIFEEFTREQTSTVTKIQGTGLGMSIVKHLVDIMGGDIKIESSVNVGTTVTINLEFKINDCLEETENKEINYNIQSLNGLKILLVEDNEMNREIATELLTEMGVILSTCEDGSIAVEKIKNANPSDFDLILMDIQMPIMNGFEATKAIRKLENNDFANIPIIAMTANAFEEDKKAALDAGMNGHLAKPIDVEQLIKTLSLYKK